MRFRDCTREGLFTPLALGRFFSRPWERLLPFRTLRLRISLILSCSLILNTLAAILSFIGRCCFRLSMRSAKFVLTVILHRLESSWILVC